MMIEPMLAANAAVFAIKNATPEGKITVIVLLLLSLFSWTIILAKFRQLLIARAATKKFLEAYGSTRDPLDIQRKPARSLRARRRTSFTSAARTNWCIN